LFFTFVGWFVYGLPFCGSHYPTVCCPFVAVAVYCPIVVYLLVVVHLRFGWLFVWLLVSGCWLLHLFVDLIVGLRLFVPLLARSVTLPRSFCVTFHCGYVCWLRLVLRLRLLRSTFVYPVGSRVTFYVYVYGLRYVGYVCCSVGLRLVGCGWLVTLVWLVRSLFTFGYPHVVVDCLDYLRLRLFRLRLVPVTFALLLPLPRLVVVWLVTFGLFVVVAPLF